MIKWKKAILTVLCLGMIMGMVACGNGGNTTNDKNNDVTEGTDHNNDNGVMDNVGDAVEDGVDDIGTGVKDVTDDLTGNDQNTDNKR